ncbi:MAG: hypothetical protein N4A40_15565 [Tissierellales bacterium]|jgi:hypothetical protein|nr:hypothetical protein [Tissierellales bacterium]
MSIVLAVLGLSFTFKVRHDLEIINKWESKFDQGIENGKKILYSEDKEELMNDIESLKNLECISIQDELDILDCKNDILRQMVYIDRHDEFGDAESDLVMKKIYLVHGFSFKSTYIPVGLANVRYIDKPIYVTSPRISRNYGERTYTERYDFRDLKELYSTLNSVNSYSEEDEILQAYMECIGKEFKGDEYAAAIVTNESGVDIYREIKKAREIVKELREVLEENKQYDQVKVKITTDKYRVFVGNRKYIACYVPTRFKFCEIHGIGGNEVNDVIEI